MNTRAEIQELLEAIATGVLCAPNDFPEEDYLPPEEQLTLGRLFEELNLRLGRIRSSIKDRDFESCHRAFQDALMLYQSGKTKDAAWRLQDAEEILRTL